MNVPSSRRAYRHPAEFAEDFRFIWKRRTLVVRTLRELIPAAFRERLMLTVTEVNGCRICSYAHARLALSAGASQEDLRQLLSGSIPADTPPAELLALTYAQHWAESDAHPDPVVREKLVEAYGEEKAEAIHIILHLIRMGNLLGNLWENGLFRLSFGRFGLSQRAR
ncbi:MAG: carboxymuconolactone decarboxylase family protein [Lentisphaerae bacterium]|nr:carboxymuconolactone decarboxylase family protein [Lentisphaerota bacterium]